MNEQQNRMSYRFSDMKKHDSYRRNDMKKEFLSFSYACFGLGFILLALAILAYGLGI